LKLERSYSFFTLSQIPDGRPKEKKKECIKSQRQKEKKVIKEDLFTTTHAHNQTLNSRSKSLQESPGNRIKLNNFVFLSTIVGFSHFVEFSKHWVVFYILLYEKGIPKNVKTSKSVKCEDKQRKKKKK